MALLAVATLASACETVRDPQWAAVEREVRQCMAATYADPAVTASARRLAFSDPTPQQRADPAYPAPADVPAIAALASGVARCHRIATDATPSLRPMMEAADTARRYQAEQVTTYLIEGAISYGQANRLLAEAAADYAAREASDQRADAASAKAANDALDDMLQRAHRAPTPLKGMTCEWLELNLDCR